MKTVVVTLANAANETRTFTGPEARWSTLEGNLKVWVDKDVAAEFYQGTWKYVVSQEVE